MKKRNFTILPALLLSASCIFTGISVQAQETEETQQTEAASDAAALPDYSLEENWAYCETEDTEKEADVFFICPTVYGGTEDSYNMAMDDEESRESFLGATNMEKGIYDENSRFFAPYYTLR